MNDTRYPSVKWLASEAWSTLRQRLEGLTDEEFFWRAMKGQG